MSEAGRTLEQSMPKINIYLPDDLADAVRDAGVPVSAICQRALEQAVRRVTVLREAATGAFDDGGPAGAPAVPFTRRAMTVLESAHASASAVPGAQVRTEHVLAALMAADNMAVRVLGTLEITPRQVQAELARRLPAEPGAGAAPDPGRPWISPAASRVLELAGNESSGLGNGFVGCEHLLLGLIAEPDGIGGSMLRSLGADLRVVRRTVAAALAGWYAAAARHEEQAASQPAAGGAAGTPSAGTPAAGTAPLAGQLSVVIQAELAPLLARIERLESGAR